jgi:cysteine desulfurase
MAGEAGRLAALRDRLEAGIAGALEGVVRNGHATRRLPNTVNLSFEWVRGEALLMGLRGLAVSSGAACTSASPGASYVLRALGRDDELAQASLRFGLGRFTTEGEIDYAVREVVRVVGALRAVSPLYEMRRQGAARPGT